jgi:hypothetical protein
VLMMSVFGENDRVEYDVSPTIHKQ